MPDSELRRAKDHLKGNLMLSLESTSSRMTHLARQDIYFDRHFTLDETLAGIEAVTADDVQRVARGPVLRRRARRRRCSAARGRSTLAPAPGMSAASDLRPRTCSRDAWSTGHDSPLHPPGDGPHLERASTASRRWLQVEIAAAEAMAEAGHRARPRRPRDIRERGAFDIARIDEIEQITQHDLIAFTTAVAEHVGPAARWLHFGLTSSDVVDTALALQMREACDLILDAARRRCAAAIRAARRRAPPHADDRPHARRARRADDASA